MTVIFLLFVQLPDLMNGQAACLLAIVPLLVRLASRSCRQQAALQWVSNAYYSWMFSLLLSEKYWEAHPS